MKRLVLLSISCLITLQAYSQDLEAFTDLSFDELNHLIDGHFDQGTHADGIIPVKAFIQKAQEAQIDSLVSEGLNNLGILYWHLGDYKKAVKIFEETRSISEKVYGKEDRRYANSLNNLAHLYQLTGNPQQALPLLIESIKISKSVVGENHINYAVSNNNLAIFYANHEEYGKAEKHYLLSMDVVKRLRGEVDENHSEYMNNLAVLYRQSGQPEKALRLHFKAKSITKKISGIKNLSYTKTLNNLAATLNHLGNYSQALPLYLQAKDILEEIGRESHPTYFTLLHNLAFQYQLLEQYEESLRFHQQALRLGEKVLGNKHPDYATSLINFGSFLVSQQKHEQALPLLIEAKNIRENLYGQLHSSYALALYQIGKSYESKGDLFKALSFQTETKNIIESVLPKQHPSHMMAFVNLARIHMKLNHFDQSKTLLQKVINIIAGDSIPLTFDDRFKDALLEVEYHSYKQLEILTRSLDLAFQLVESNERILNKTKNLTKITEVVNELLIKTRNEVIDEKDKLRLLSLSHLWLQRSLKLLDPEIHATKAMEVADQNKSVLLLEATKAEAKYRLADLPDSLIWHDRKLLKKQSELHAKLLERKSETKTDSLLDKLNEINQQIDDFAELVSKKHPKYYKIKYQQTDATLSGIQSSLGKSQAMLEYVVSDSTLHIFYVGQSSIQWLKVPVTSSELSNRIQSLHTSLSNYYSDTTFTHQAHWFYKTLIAPVLAGKSEIKDLIIVPDGELAHLPFETFLVEPAPEEGIRYGGLHYLLKEYNISYNFSATLWKENTEAPEPQNNGQIFGIAGNYQLKNDSSRAALRLPTDQWTRAGLIQLPAAREEVASLQEKYQGYFAFDSLASEKQVKALTSDYSILHFATHGILDKERPMLSALALSEDGDSIESNFWQAHEISKAQLNANLVVLSACETGYGKFETGNGVASLARAFMYAGAQALVVSLWQVNDLSTRDLMENFYDQLDKGLNKDEALRNAKLEYLQSAQWPYTHPAFWSSFILMGKTDTVNIKNKNLLNVWNFSIFIIILLSVGRFLLSRKRSQVHH